MNSSHLKKISNKIYLQGENALKKGNVSANQPSRAGWPLRSAPPPQPPGQWSRTRRKMQGLWPGAINTLPAGEGLAAGYPDLSIFLPSSRKHQLLPHDLGPQIKEETQRGKEMGQAEITVGTRYWAHEESGFCSPYLLNIIKQNKPLIISLYFARSRTRKPHKFFFQVIEGIPGLSSYLKREAQEISLVHLPWEPRELLRNAEEECQPV